MTNSPAQPDKTTWQSAFEEAQATLQAFRNDPAQLEKCEKFTQVLDQQLDKFEHTQKPANENDSDAPVAKSSDL